MGLQDKIARAKPSNLFDDIPEWEQKLLVKWALFKLKIIKRITNRFQ